MLRIEKDWRSKSNFLKFLCRELAIWLSAKKSVPSVLFFAESFFVGSRQTSLFAESFFFAGSFLFGSRQSHLCREFFIWLSAKTRTLDKDTNSGSD
jgi:hypothetical protein